MVTAQLAGAKAEGQDKVAKLGDLQEKLTKLEDSHQTAFKALQVRQETHAITLQTMHA